MPLVVLAGMLGAGFFFTPADLPAGDVCLFKRFFLFECPGCGLTRAFLLIPRGDFLGAFRLNAAAPFLYALFLWGFVQQARAACGKPVANAVAKVPSRAVFLLGQLIALILAAQGFVRAWAFFSAHPVSEYASNLSHRGGPFSAWAQILLAVLPP